MKTTLSLDESVMRRLKEQAAREGRTMSELVDEALRTLLDGRRSKPKRLRPLPRHDMGRELVDVTDRRAVLRILDDDVAR